MHSLPYIALGFLMLAIFALLIVLGDMWIKIFKLEEGKKVKKFPLNILGELAYGGGITFSLLPWPLKDEDFNKVEAKKLCKKEIIGCLYFLQFY